MPYWGSPPRMAAFHALPSRHCQLKRRLGGIARQHPATYPAQHWEFWQMMRGGDHCITRLLHPTLSSPTLHHPSRNARQAERFTAMMLRQPRMA